MVRNNSIELLLESRFAVIGLADIVLESRLAGQSFLACYSDCHRYFPRGHGSPRFHWFGSGYQAFSALQYEHRHVTALNSVRLVDPRDLSRDIQTNLTLWAPFWSCMYAIAFHAGLSPGTAGRFFGFSMSLIGALGWVVLSASVGLKGYWRMAGVVFAALYCPRIGSFLTSGSGDQVIYAVSPWLMRAALPLARPLAHPVRWRAVGLTALFLLALESVFWLKYTGVFMSAAVGGAVVWNSFAGLPGPALYWLRRSFAFTARHVPHRFWYCS